jgi:hypothetical protein
MAYKHTFKNTGDGNFYLATESGVPKLHSYEEESIVNLTMYQSGSDVILTAEGSFHDPQTSLQTWYGTPNAYVYPHLARFDFMGQSSDTGYRIPLTSSQNTLGDLGGTVVQHSNTLNSDLPAHFVIDRFDIRIRPDYVWGTPFSQTVTFSNKTLVELGYEVFNTFSVAYGTGGRYIVNLNVVAPPTPTPTSTSTPTPTPTLSVTPTPSYQNSTTFGVFGATNDGTGLTGTGDSDGFDGGGYTYSWDSINSAATVYFDAGSNWISDSTSGEVFPIGTVATRGTVVNQPRFFKPFVSGYSGVTVTCPYANKRRVWLLGAGVEGGGTINYTYSYRDVSTNQYYSTSVDSVAMDDWCAGSTSQSVAVAMTRRNAANGSGQTLNCRIYRYQLVQIPSGYEIKSISFGNNSSGEKCRIVSIAFADS